MGKLNNIIHNPGILLKQMSSYGLLKFVPDSVYLSLIYRFETKEKLNLSNPSKFNEKLQWLKLHDKKTIYTTMVDKYAVKKYVADIIGEKYIIPTLGVWNHFDEIDFDKLPDQFVLKCTHDSGGLVIVRDKAKLDQKAAKKKIEKSLKHNYYNGYREWPYKDVKARIIAEKYIDNGLSDSKIIGLTDYKFFCFDGQPEFLYISRGLENHHTAEISFYDLEGNEMPFHRSDYKQYHNAVMPSNFNELKEIAARLALDVDRPFVRIDLYSINENIYFSEITFSPCSGMIPFEPLSADEELGKMLKLSTGE